jgi:hypothetical protein
VVQVALNALAVQLPVPKRAMDISWLPELLQHASVLLLVQLALML